MGGEPLERDGLFAAAFVFVEGSGVVDTQAERGHRGFGGGRADTAEVHRLPRAQPITYEQAMHEAAHEGLKPVPRDAQPPAL